jgi:hypothetical protein
MTRIDDPMKLVADLKPALLDRLAEEGYSRRRQDDLARAVAEAQASGSPARRHQTAHGRGTRWSLLAGGSAVTAAAVMAAVVLTGGPATQGKGHPQPPAAASSGRAVLLASAIVASRAPATAGPYWYVRERDFEPPASHGSKAPGSASAVVPATQRTFGATVASTEESWTGPARGRTIVNEDVTVSFASAADKARWEAAGEPKLAAADGAVTSNYHMKFQWGSGTSQLTWGGVRKLPVTAAALGKVLHRMWNAEPDKAAAVGFPHPDFSQYLVQWAVILLTGPARPGTRAATYQLLAEQSGVTTINHVTDPLGRKGIAVGDGGGDYLVLDPHTARVLAYTTSPVHPDATITAAKGVTVYVATGWATRLGVVPARR